MRNSIIIIIFLSWTSHVAAQTSVPFDKKSIPDKEVYKKAMLALGEGDLYYADDFTANFDSALYYYKIANEINPNNAELNLKIGRCYLDLPSGKETMKCMEYFNKALQLDPDVDPMIYFYMGKAFHVNSDWKKAIGKYSEFQSKLDPKKNQAEKIKVGRHIQECRNGILLSENPVKAKFENMGDWINTAYREHSPIISSNASVMYFTGRLPNSTGGEKEPNGMYYEDVYVMHKRKDGWSKPRNAGRTINSVNHDATISLSADGRNIIIMREGDLYHATLKGSDWSTPTPFPKIINGKGEETGASYADDGNTLYFISDRQPSIGGKDIFVSKKDELGNWSEPENLGAIINTKYDENGVFMHPDGSTFYFVSEGHNSIGGTDIFKSVKTDEGWSAPINMGIPINTPKDEQCIVVSADYRLGYYSSKGKDTHGDHDLYKVTFLEVNEPMHMVVGEDVATSFENKVKSVTVEGDLDYALLAGTVTDHSDDTPLAARVVIKNTRNNVIIKEIYTDENSGKFLTSLPIDQNYEIVVRSRGYLYYAEEFKAFGSKGHELEYIDAKIKEIIPNQTLVLKNVFFKKAKAEMLPESYAELDRLVQILRENSGIVIEIGGHTDAIGNPAKLMKLSRQRMETVRSYLANRGINRKRLKGRGYGGTKPIADNHDPKTRALNRRVEFKILSVQ